jgi:hypothetical protein
MKYTTCLSLLSLLSLTAAVAAPVYAQSNNGHSLVEPKLQRSLKSLGIKVALPKYVPQGFRVALVRTEPCRKGDRIDANGVCRFGPDYTVVYRNAQSQCFGVSATGGGLGGPSGRYTREVNTKLLGKVDVNIGTGNGDPITEAIANTPQENVWTFPAGKSPFYSVRTIDARIPGWLSSEITCKNTAFMTPNELIKIVQSLEFLR